ncbi:MAG: three-Cys-motif partner protein TcmP [Telluria sp.]|nr:three-Cys-motif partner protein TcmP [Telluria sp.]
MIKLDLLGRYLTFFNTALQRQPRPASPFDRIYIDAFAGTGKCEIKLTDGTRSTINGSAKIAAHTAPAFHQIHLVDLKKKHVAELKILATSGSSSEIHVHKDDANSALEAIISKVNWRRTRGVLFLDPYGMAVRWETLQTIARTEALDVWYLFPLSAVYRQAAKDFDKVDEGKAAKLDTVLGTPDWRTVFYEKSGQNSLLPDDNPSTRRTAGPPEISTYIHSRLSEIFHGWVSPPIFLPEVGPPMFALFFAVANPSESAVKLSKKAAEHLFSMLRNKKIGQLARTTVLDESQPNLF